tara:strand:- start:1619 stop:2797 length:1179 start_codon:yes stop_codon:yes gene_type:complete
LKNKFKISIAGSGYVGMSLGVLLAQNNKVSIYDINENRVNRVNNKQSTVLDSEIEKFLQTKKIDLSATVNLQESLIDSDFLIIATPTDYDSVNNSFDTSSVQKVIEQTRKIDKNIFIVIKSTIPVGFTDEIQSKYKDKNIIFSPEFLREGKALHDNLYPSRVIIGGNSNKSKIFAKLLVQSSNNKNTDVLFMSSKEAEAVKLFSNSYLAMRVSFFNELDSFAMHHKISTKNIIKGVSTDKRIGSHYNNPSLGYGGYCLPKDTKQLLSSYKDIPQNLISAIVTSNQTRKEFISNKIIELNPKSIGFYLLSMKKGSDNYRDSAIISIIKIIQTHGIKSIIYDPKIEDSEFLGIEIIKDLSDFKEKSDLIIANRLDENIDDCIQKVFCRDLFGKD